jgi:transposase
LPENIDDAALDSMLFALPPNEERRKPMPCWKTVHKELSRKGVTLKLLWEEYRQTTPEGFSYAQFLRHYRRWNGKLHVSMRQRHKAGEKLFVDFAGHTMDVVDPETGEVSTAQIFVATLGFSNLTFVRALSSQGLEDWIEAHNRALRFLGGVPEIVVPDNLKSGVKSPCRYEPEINPTYQEWAEHNKLAVVPARVRKPKDKSKVEVAVQIVERRVMAPLRNRRFPARTRLRPATGILEETGNPRNAIRCRVQNGFEIANQKHTEITPGRNGLTTTGLSVMLGAKHLYKAIEIVLAKNDLKLVVKNMPLRTGHLIITDPHPVLPVALFSETHESSLYGDSIRHYWDFFNRLLLLKTLQSCWRELNLQ